MELVVVLGLLLHIQGLRLSAISSKGTNGSEVHLEFILVLAQLRQNELDQTVEARAATPLSIPSYLQQL